MPTTAPLLTGWNLIFIVPFALGAILALISVLAAGGGHGHGGGAGHGAGHGHAAHGHAAHGRFGHGHVGHGQGGGHHAGHAHTALTQTTQTQTHGHHTSHPQTASHRHAVRGGEKMQSAERASKVARGAVPPLIVIQNFLLFGGLCGLIANLLHGTAPSALPVLSILVALLGGVLLTMLTSALLVHLLPAGTTSVSTNYDLEGRAGEADTPITAAGGSAYVRDWNGTLHHVPCRLRPRGAEESNRAAESDDAGSNEETNRDEDRLPAGTPVLLVEFNANMSYYEVRRWKEKRNNELV